MTRKVDTEVTLRPKRQLTLPLEICKRLNIEPGDMLELTVEGSVLTAQPKKARALDSLHEIRDSFSRSGITEEELIKAGRRTRRKINQERHAGNR